MIFYIGLTFLILVLIFVGYMIFKKDSVTNTSKFDDFIDEIKLNNKQKREDNIIMKKLQREARIEALKELKPVIKEKIKEQELKKLTGEDKKEKLQKFADAFSMKGSGIGSTEKINSMLSVGNTSNNSNTIFSDDKLNYMLGNNQNNGNIKKSNKNGF